LAAMISSFFVCRTRPQRLPPRTWGGGNCLVSVRFPDKSQPPAPKILRPIRYIDPSHASWPCLARNGDQNAASMTCLYFLTPSFFPVQATTPGVKMLHRGVIAALLTLSLFQAGAQQDVVITSVWPSRGSLAGPLSPLMFFLKPSVTPSCLDVGGGGGRSRCFGPNNMHFLPGFCFRSAIFTPFHSATLIPSA
jgi:hypothetical protein